MTSTSFVDLLKLDPYVDYFLQKLSHKKSLVLEKIGSSAKIFLLQRLMELQKRPILVITTDTEEGSLALDAQFFSIKPLWHFPAWDTLPGDALDPNLDLVGERLKLLHSLASFSSPFMVFASLHALLQTIPSKETLSHSFHSWKIADQVSFSDLPAFLKGLGYTQVAVVTEKGSFAVRGGIIDLFCPIHSYPHRIEFFEDEIVSLRTFDPSSQKSLQKLEQMVVSPLQEAPEAKKSCLLDYLPPTTCIVFNDLYALEEHWIKWKGALAATTPLFLSMEELLFKTETFTRIYCTKEELSSLVEVEFHEKPGRSFYHNQDSTQAISFSFFSKNLHASLCPHPFLPLPSLKEGLNPLLSHTPYFICASEQEQLSMQKTWPSTHPAYFERGYLAEGFFFQTKDHSLSVVPMSALTHRFLTDRHSWRDVPVTTQEEHSFSPLVPGDLVVHFHHGIGEFLGMEKKANHLGIETEFLTLKYAQNSLLYVPVAQSHLVSRYVSTTETIPTLHDLGSGQWKKMRLKAEQSIVGYAQDLIRLQAERIVKGGFAFPPDGEMLRRFEEEFFYTPTKDQLQAIQEIKQDMMQPKAMDRLLCGDVGYGKTEVAMRAAFKAACEGKKQVAVLVPTTVLSMQHYETFCQRMMLYPVKVAALSRLQSKKEAETILKEVKEGSIDILIGTHRLLSEDVHFKDLGLIIVDEEQKFGVRAKEALKKLKVGVDVLSMSATPIPRTLYMSLMGAKDISTIATPPRERIPVKVLVLEKNRETIKQALLREFSRDGQAFFIHNRVESLPQVKEELQALVPQARIGVVHGQMDAEIIDEVFNRFKIGEIDLLISTSLIENGVDVPNANTILIDKADHFGLADLYQLKGRVGRWNRPAYAYLFVGKQDRLSDISRQRLQVLIDIQGYGGGLKLAMEDLKIRGGGDFVGTQQSGQVASIGFHLYCKLLKKAALALQNKEDVCFIETKMEFPYPAFLPTSYVTDPPLRLEIYQRMGEIQKEKELEELHKELEDRFGKAPLPLLWLLSLTLLRIKASRLQCTLLKFGTKTLEIERKRGAKIEKTAFTLPPIASPYDLEKAMEGLLAGLRDI